ncbi:MAG: AmmeMemoRadiSam system protein A, partial [Dehalococcoidia bacterium]
MAVVFACISPHPPIIVREVGHGRERQTSATIAALEQVAQAMAGHAPQTTVVIATHGPIRHDAFGVLTAPLAEGDFALWGAPQVRLSFPNDLEAVALIRQEARQAGVPLAPIQRWDG